MQTIVQDYGPIYGEVVNGTVQGRPNGSVYVPLYNTIEFSLMASTPDPPTIKQVGSGNTGINLNPKFEVVAKSQDLASNIRTTVYTDAECTTVYCSRNFAAGLFNITNWAYLGNNATPPVSETSYYLRFELINNSTLVAVSDILEVVGY